MHHRQTNALLSKYGLGKYANAATVPVRDLVSICEQLEWAETELAATRQTARKRPAAVSKPRQLDAVGKKHTKMMAKYAAWGTGIKAVLYEAVPYELWFRGATYTALAVFFGHEIVEAAMVWAINCAVVGGAKWFFVHK